MVPDAHGCGRRERRGALQDGAGMSIMGAVEKGQTGEFELFLLLLLFHLTIAIATSTTRTRLCQLQPPYTVQNRGFTEHVPPQRLLLRPYRDLGAATVDNIGCRNGKRTGEPRGYQEEAESTFLLPRRGELSVDVCERATALQRAGGVILGR